MIHEVNDNLPFFRSPFADHATHPDMDGAPALLNCSMTAHPSTQALQTPRMNLKGRSWL